MKKSIITMLLFAMTITITAQTARVQVIHNSADAAAEFVDVYLNDALLIPNFEFRTASPFIDAPAGEEIELSVAPPNSSGVEDAIYTAPVTLTEGETYVVVADGIVSGSGYNPPQDFGLQIYPLGREAASDPANTDVLVHHGSTDAPAVDVVETGVGAGTIVDDLAYTEFQGYLELPTADYTLQINASYVGLDAHEQSLFNVYPNPSFGDLNLTPNAGTFQFLDLQGNVIQTLNTDKQSFYNFDFLDAGVYFLKENRNKPCQ